MKVAVVGATGRLGRLICELGVESGLDMLAVSSPRSLGSVVAGLTTVGVDEAGAADVVIDVSLPDATEHVLAVTGQLPIVIGTTGHTPAQRAEIDRCSTSRPVLLASNFSAGVHLLTALAELAARVMPHADIEIVETHHKHKRDAPSGTAITLGESVADARAVALEDVGVHGRHGAVGARPSGEIGFHALRGGDVVGEHSVHFFALGERIELRHAATSRGTFASGALRAAQWLASRNAGAYTMADVLGLQPRP